MNILHVSIACHYTENMTYQDNQLSEQNALDGHAVTVISDCFKHEGSKIVKIPEEDTILDNGIRLIRVEYDLIIHPLISSKIRKVNKLYKIIKDIKPDVILFHGAAGYEMLTVAKYKKNNPKIKLYVDSHQDFHNSGTFWLSKVIQYKLFNRYIVNNIKGIVDKFLYISYESKDFLKIIYGLEDDKLEFYPLGGNIIEEVDKNQFSNEIRAQHGYTNNDILVLHTGKLAPSKKTKDLILAFKSVTDPHLKLIIVGSIPIDYSQILSDLIQSDERINFVGWKNSNEFKKYLCAADLYFQPGTQSATMQNAICCGTPVALAPYSSHEPYLKGNGFYIKSVEEYINVFKKISQDPNLLKKMSKSSYEIARDILDYRMLAARLYE